MEYKAFKDLTKEERSEIVEAFVSGKGIEVSLVVGDMHKQWVDNPSYIWPDSAYRIKPAKKLHIPWEIIKPEYKWAAMDGNGVVFVYEEVPVKASGWWNVRVNNGVASCISETLSIDTTGISWENSLTQRPE